MNELKILWVDTINNGSGNLQVSTSMGMVS